jgi:hypothetical protein
MTALDILLMNFSYQWKYKQPLASKCQCDSIDILCKFYLYLIKRMMNLWNYVIFYHLPMRFVFVFLLYPEDDRTSNSLSIWDSYIHSYSTCTMIKNLRICNSHYVILINQKIKKELQHKEPISYNYICMQSS